MGGVECCLTETAEADIIKSGGAEMCDFLARDGLSVALLERLSYKTELGLSLKNSIGHFQKTEILSEIEKISEWYDSQEALNDLPLDYRIKS